MEKGSLGLLFVHGFLCKLARGELSDSLGHHDLVTLLNLTFLRNGLNSLLYFNVTSSFISHRLCYRDLIFTVDCYYINTLLSRLQ